MKSPKDVLALGQAIVENLELPDRGAVLERWLSHHLAQVIAEADGAVGPAKAVSEARAVDLVLKLWAQRRVLPKQADPLGGYRKAIDVLGRLMPEANPWAHLRQSGTTDELLREMFELLRTIVLTGIQLTQATRARTITAEESDWLAEEEKHLQSVLRQWMPFVPGAREKSESEFDFEDTDLSQQEERNVEVERSYGSGVGDQTIERDVEPSNDLLHAAIVSELGDVRTRLDELLNLWRKSAPRELEDQ